MSQQSNGESLDLQSLVSAANKQIERTENQHARKESTTLARFLTAHWLQLLLVVVALAVLFAQGPELRRQIFGVPLAAIQLQAESVLNAARAAVEQYRKTNGSLPDRVPLTALDAMVTMESSGSNYQLTVVLNGKMWQMDSQGTFSGGK